MQTSIIYHYLTPLLLFLVNLSLPNKPLCAQSPSNTLNIAKKMLHVTEQKRFVIVVASYNNEQYFKANLDSIFSQEYENYHVIYTTDASTDKTYECVVRYIHEHGLAEKITLINNKENQGAMRNIHNMVHTLNNNDIVLIVDGDDALSSSQVLKNLNAYYANKDVWLTYGQYTNLSNNVIGEYSKPCTTKYLQEAHFRKNPWIFSHLRTFYAGLFKRIQLKDLIKNGLFFSSACDLAIMYPMLEMAREHAYFTNEVFYLYNDINIINDHKKNRSKQAYFQNYVAKLPAYNKLLLHPKTLTSEQLEKNDQADLVVFSYDRPMQLYACLESIEKHARNLHRTSVIYRTSDAKFDAGYEIVKQRFKSAFFYQQPSHRAMERFKRMVLFTSFSKTISKANYITYCVDDIILTDTINFKTAIAKMQETGAYGFFFRLGKNINYCYMMNCQESVPDLINLDATTFAWPFTKGLDDWSAINNVDFTLYKKNTIVRDLLSFSFIYPTDMEQAWKDNEKRDNRFGLCAETSKIINIPMNVVSNLQNPRNMNLYTTEELNELFLAGNKIDIQAFYKIKCNSVHVDIEPTFISRDAAS